MRKVQYWAPGRPIRKITKTRNTEIVTYLDGSVTTTPRISDKVFKRIIDDIDEEDES